MNSARHGNCDFIAAKGLSRFFIFNENRADIRADTAADFYPEINRIADSNIFRQLDNGTARFIIVAHYPADKATAIVRPFVAHHEFALFLFQISRRKITVEYLRQVFLHILRQIRPLIIRIDFLAVRIDNDSHIFRLFHATFQF